MKWTLQQTKNPGQTLASDRLGDEIIDGLSGGTIRRGSIQDAR